MADITRRSFLGTGGKVALGAVAGAGAVTLPVVGEESRLLSDRMQRDAAGTHAAILFDSTLCIGCRACELACNDANKLGRTPDQVFAGHEAQDFRALAPDAFTVVTQHDAPWSGGGVAFGKAQCMHCVEPACATSCPVQALQKTPEGPVVWYGDLCLGCRYCMMACPFQVPRFEWQSTNPEIRKCRMCHDRIVQGDKPACVGICPTGALAFGTRRDLLAEAHRRIVEKPRGYVHRVYGEEEVGGTSVLILAGQPFHRLGYPDPLPTSPVGERVRPAMAAVPAVLNGLILALGASAWLVRRKSEHRSQGEKELP